MVAAMVMTVGDVFRFIFRHIKERLHQLVLFAPTTAPRQFVVVIVLALAVLALYAYVSIGDLI